jgi:ribosomal protein L28
MERSGNDRVLYLDDFLTWYSGRPITSCHKLMNAYNIRKSRMKKTFKVKPNLTAKAEYLEKDKKPKKNLPMLATALEVLDKDCRIKMKKQV